MLIAVLGSNHDAGFGWVPPLPQVAEWPICTDHAGGERVRMLEVPQGLPAKHSLAITHALVQGGRGS